MVLGHYQVFTLRLIILAVIFHSSVNVAFLFIAKDLHYRCSIPECDTQQPEFYPPWLPTAVPFKNNNPSRCDRYFYNSSESLNETCSPNNFHNSEIRRCSSFVYKTKENSILHEYGLQCEENAWKLSMVGTVNNFGQFVGMFLGGILADQYNNKRRS